MDDLAGRTLAGRYDLLATLQADTARGAGPLGAQLFEAAHTALRAGVWAPTRDTLLALVREASPNVRRTSFAAQITAELAAWFEDDATCAAMIHEAADAGLFDRHWLERCPLLDRVRVLPDIARVRLRVQRRAEAILDALYGDENLELAAETKVL